MAAQIGPMRQDGAVACLAQGGDLEAARATLLAWQRKGKTAIPDDGRARR